MGAVFFIPWEIEDTGELKWAPFYRNPIKHTASYTDEAGTLTTYTRLGGHRAIGVYALQLLVITGIGGIAFVAAGSDPEDDEDEDAIDPVV